jgi:hypothetical protein
VDMTGLSFLGSVGYDGAQVRGFAAGGHGSDGDEEEGVGTFGLGDATSGETLGEASNLFSAAAIPDVAIRALEERLYSMLSPESTWSAACTACVVSSRMAMVSVGLEAARAVSMRARFFAGGRCWRPLRRGPGLGWLEGSPIVGGATAVGGVTTVGGAKTVGGATTARGAVGSTVLVPQLAPSELVHRGAWSGGGEGGMPPWSTRRPRGHEQAPSRQEQGRVWQREQGQQWQEVRAQGQGRGWAMARWEARGLRLG